MGLSFRSKDYPGESARWPYSSFMAFRIKLAAQIGINLREMSPAEMFKYLGLTESDWLIYVRNVLASDTTSRDMFSMSASLLMYPREGNDIHDGPRS